MIQNIGYSWEGEDLLIQVRIQPKSSRDELIGLHDGRFKICITAPPVDGKANAHLTGLLAKLFGVSKGRVTLVRGASSKTKTLRIQAPGKLPAQISKRP